MNLLDRDKRFVWHPFTQVKLEGAPVAVDRAEGTLIFDQDGKSYIDATSSWWVNLHGHSHPHILKSIASQMEKLDQVIFAGFTHPSAVDLAEKLVSLMPKKDYKAFYSDDGSTAVEVGLKMAIQYWFNKGEKRKTIVCLEGAYHGDTLGAMSLGAKGVFRAPYEDFVFEVQYIPRPDPDKYEQSLDAFKQVLAKGDCAAFIFEPLVQGASGMKIYPADGLEKLIEIAKSESVICIADEVFTGFGRTGKILASDYLKLKPDIFAFSKGITGGVVPLGATLAPGFIFDAFLADDRQKMFLHGHSFTANAISCAAANASMELLFHQSTAAKISKINKLHSTFLNELCKNIRVSNQRVLGTILAFEIDAGKDGYLNPLRDKLYKFYIEQGVILRPLGNTVYIVPPYCITERELGTVYSVILDSLEKVK